MARFEFSTTADDAAAVFADQIKGKTVLITGISPKGLSTEAARSIAKHNPALMIFASRTPANIEKAVNEIKESTPDVNIRSLELDLASQESVRKAAKEVNAYTENIDVLINSASIVAHNYAVTPEGIESGFGTSHIGHFLFTNLIMRKILAAGPGARIVSVSSRGHRRSDIRWDDINFDNGKAYDGFASYGQSKTANILFAVSLSDKLKDKGVESFSLHPGAVLETSLSRDIPMSALIAMGLLKEDGTLREDLGLQPKTLPQGASSYIIAAFDPSIKGASGAYLYDGYLEGPGVEAAQPYAVDPASAERLWTLSEKLVGQKFAY